MRQGLAGFLWLALIKLLICFGPTYTSSQNSSNLPIKFLHKKLAVALGSLLLFAPHVYISMRIRIGRISQPIPYKVEGQHGYHYETPRNEQPWC